MQIKSLVKLIRMSFDMATRCLDWIGGERVRVVVVYGFCGDIRVGRGGELVAQEHVGVVGGLEDDLRGRGKRLALVGL